jgi:hypothetical protein
VQPADVKFSFRNHYDITELEGFVKVLRSGLLHCATVSLEGDLQNPSDRA